MIAVREKKKMLCVVRVVFEIAGRRIRWIAFIFLSWTAARAEEPPPSAPASPPGAALADLDPFSDEAASALSKWAADQAPPTPSFLAPGQIKTLTDKVRPSLVTVRQIGRDGKTRGTGSGFFISTDGLVATNLHVIGEGRPIEIETAAGERFEAIEVHASDRRYDLAIVRLDAKGKTFPPLVIGDSAIVAQGDFVAGFGTPQGLSFSVVPGVISAIRQLDADFLGEGETPDFPLLQLAMPIEQGNSGGPVVGLDGQVLGIVTLKHRVTENLGFAVPSKDLQRLLDTPNPVPMSRWRTIGVLDPNRWTPVLGGDWSQRGGIIRTSEGGDGFGGRALCLAESKVPELPYEVAVQVKLEDEGGAAGLAFAADGGDIHYGFYPSNGKIRLTRFEGADVYSWSILVEEDAPLYFPGEWNHLRIRVEETLLTGWVNGQKVLEIEDDVLRGGQVGLCKFRQTLAEFRSFAIGSNLSEPVLSPETKTKLEQTIEQYLKGDQSAVVTLGGSPSDSPRIIREMSESLAARMAQLEQLESALQRQVVVQELTMVLDRPKEEIDLYEAGLQIARIDDPDLDLPHYREVLDQLVDSARDYVTKATVEAGDRERAIALRDFLFSESGFHGSRNEYYHHDNSYVNRVMDDREGLPITLGIIFIEMARRLEIKGVHGVPLPGKFMVAVETSDGIEDEGTYFDVFEEGALLTREEVAAEVMAMVGEAPSKESFLPAEGRDIVLRILRNLVDIEINQRGQPAEATKFIEVVLALHPEAAGERFQRALLRVQEKDLDGARDDLDWLLDRRPPGLDYQRLQQYRDSLAE